MQGDVKKLTDDVAALRPSLFVAVPRVLERIQSGIATKLKQKNWIVRFLFNIAYSFKLRAIKRGKSVDQVASPSELLSLLQSWPSQQRRSGSLSAL